MSTEAEVEVLNIQINADGVDETKTSISGLKSTLEALKEIANVAKPKPIGLPRGFNTLFNKVDDMRKVTRSLKGLKKTMTSYQDLKSDGFKDTMETMFKTLPKLDGERNANSMSKLLRQVNRLPKVLEEFNSVKLDGFKNVTSEIKNMVDNIKELNDVPNLKDFISAAKKLGKVEAPKLEGKVSPEIPDTPELSSKLIEDIGLIETLKGKFGELKSTILTTMPKGVAALAWFGDKAKSVIGKLGSGIRKVGTKIKSMIAYRALNSIVQFVSKALKEGIMNLYQYSKVSDGVFSKSMDKIASSTLYVKNAFGSLMGALIEKAAPYIEYIMDRIGDCLNGIRKFYAELTGAQSWTKAKKVPIEFAEGAEKLKRAILGFDKLNVLDFGKLEKASKSKTLTGAKTPSKAKYSTMFEEVKVNVDDKGKLSKTRERVNSLKDSLGELIGELGRTKDQIFTKENKENFLNSAIGASSELFDLLAKIQKKLNDLKLPEKFVHELYVVSETIRVLLAKLNGKDEIVEHIHPEIDKYNELGGELAKRGVHWYNHPLLALRLAEGADYIEEGDMTGLAEVNKIIRDWLDKHPLSQSTRQSNSANGNKKVSTVTQSIKMGNKKDTNIFSKGKTGAERYIESLFHQHYKTVKDNRIDLSKNKKLNSLLLDGRGYLELETPDIENLAKVNTELAREIPRILSEMNRAKGNSQVGARVNSKQKQVTKVVTNATFGVSNFNETKQRGDIILGIV